MSPKDKYNKALALLDEYIRSNNLRHTPERETILTILTELNLPVFTAQDIAPAAKEAHISLPTLYNSLSLFVSARILYSMSSSNGALHIEYRWALDATSRMRIICSRCGREARFTDKALLQTVHLRKYTNFLPEHFALTVYGECKVCRKLPVNKRKSASNTTHRNNG